MVEEPQLLESELKMLGARIQAVRDTGTKAALVNLAQVVLREIAVVGEIVGPLPVQTRAERPVQIQIRHASVSKDALASGNGIIKCPYCGEPIELRSS